MAQIAPTTDAAPSSPSGFLASRKGWMVTVVIWILALALAGSLLWVLPQAASSRRLSHDISGLKASLSAASASLAKANQAVASLQADLEASQAEGDQLVARAKRNEKRIENLNAEIAALRGRPSPTSTRSRTP